MSLESLRLRQLKIIRKFQAICLNMSRRLQLPEALHSARSVFLSLARFWRTRERLCSSRVRYLLNIRGRLLGYGFEPRPVLATVGSAMSIGLSINGCSHSKKTVWRERTRLTSPKVWAAVTWQKGLTWFRQSNRHLAFYQELESRLRKIAINGNFLCLTCKVTHKYALLYHFIHKLFVLLKKVEKTCIFTQKLLDHLLLMTSYLVTIFNWP